MMRVVMIEGYVNDRVRGVLREAFGTDDVPIVGYNSEGWWCQMAYVDTDEVLDSDALRRIQLDIFDSEEDMEEGIYDPPEYVKWFESAEDATIHVNDGEEDINRWGKPFVVVAWCVGGSDDNEDDVYQE